MQGIDNGNKRNRSGIKNGQHYGIQESKSPYKRCSFKLKKFGWA